MTEKLVGRFLAFLALNLGTIRNQASRFETPFGDSDASASIPAESDRRHEAVARKVCVTDRFDNTSPLPLRRNVVSRVPAWSYVSHVAPA